MSAIRLAALLSAAILAACSDAALEARDDETTRAPEPHAVSQAALPQLAATTPAQSGAVSTEPIVYDDPQLTCHKLVAYRAPAQRQDKYAVPSRPDLYVGFDMKAPWKGLQYVKSLRVLIDNRQAIHHLILFRNLNGGSDAVVEDTSGKHPDGEMLFGWSPGGTDVYFGADVAMAVPEGSTFQLETHYNNLTGAPVPDASGVEVCVTPRAPKHVAALSYVGEDRINGSAATGACTPDTKQPAHLILGLPHMHKKGVHMKVDVTRASGAVETLHDQPFDFNYQRSYVLDDVIVAPGDKLTTTCTYAQPVRFGKGTEDEMCFFFTLHWPAGALSRVSPFTAYHGPNTCIDP